MSEQFVKVETSFLSHRKSSELRDAAAGVWLRGLLLAKAVGTSGIVPRRLLHVDDVGTIDELVEAGLWEPDDAGWRIHDWGGHQTDPDYAAMGRRSVQVRRERFGTAQPNAPEPRSEPFAEPRSPERPEGDRDRDRDSISSPGITPDEITALWNGHRGSLPELRKVPQHGEPARLLRQVQEWFGEDREALIRSVQRVAQDEHYQQGHYGFENWARHLSRFGDPGGVEPLLDEPAESLPAEIDPEGQARIQELLARVGRLAL
jgi:hypothetical protein